ncbi:N-acetyltransferase [Tenuibacillus multivorans]|uniref:Predicted N-acyltransferase, GNAT family n=2 Tax=Tenuibacillus multivorans TaxID=237069 RepID=A0A1H0EJK2_9BACI|nr:GNAT family N-acetyltransferase [Tenuibacillus multivorans]GEL77132.1 N-acetyltransferase [Tenuibacillus multivorans]SDN82510.1 Predicted N-acyltransferase, GNAT family [Tenuibacillus multivorans]
MKPSNSVNKMNIIKVDHDKQLEDAYSVRQTVFIKEQNVPPDIELDEHDQTAVHFVGYNGDQPIAASRLRLVDDYGKLERICVLKEERGKQYGVQIIHHMESYLSEQGFKKSKLNAQKHAEDFYKKIGYKTISGEFMDAGIPHVTMVKELS